MYRPEVPLSSVVRASSSGEAAGYSIDYLSVTSLMPPWGDRLSEGGRPLRVVGRLWYFGHFGRVEVTSSAWVDPPGRVGLGHS